MNGSQQDYQGPNPLGPREDKWTQGMVAPARRTLVGILIGVGASVFALASSLRDPLSPDMRARALVLAIGLRATLGALFGAVARACESRERARDAFVGRLTGAAIGFLSGCLLGSVTSPGYWIRAAVVGAVSGAVLDGVAERMSGRLTLGKIMAAIALVAVVLGAFRMVAS
jgi:hypothetical protein